MSTTIRIGCMNGTLGEKQKALQAAVLLEAIINGQEFKDKVLSFVNAKRKLEFAENQGLSNLQVYEVLMSGREELKPEVDYTWDFQVRFYYGRFSKVIGYTYPNITYINVNTKFFKKYQLWEVAGNYAHEYCHKLGFGHRSATQYDSIPYAIGYIVAELGEKYVKLLAEKNAPLTVN